MVVAENIPDVTNNELAIQKLQDDWEAGNATLMAQYLAQLQTDETLAEQRRQQEEEARRLKEEEQRQRDGETAK